MECISFQACISALISVPVREYVCICNFMRNREIDKMGKKRSMNVCACVRLRLRTSYTISSNESPLDYHESSPQYTSGGLPVIKPRAGLPACLCVTKGKN